MPTARSFGANRVTGPVTGGNYTRKERLDLHLDGAARLVTPQTQPKNGHRYEEEDDRPGKQFRQSLPGEGADELSGYRTDERGRDHGEEDQLGIVIEQRDRVYTKCDHRVHGEISSGY